ncbi:MAG: FAD-dependent oxidoreductase [Lachnospiraceae bacterium]|nr:FAD-dependent oxidoreductase [Lachnospiraceae bacterium]
MKKVIIIGAGPAGLTAGYDLLSKSSDYEVTIVEESSVVGGLCARLENEENVLDAGGHMFISKNPAVKNFWTSILPAQGVPSKDDKIIDRYCKIHNGGPDPDVEEDVILSREKLTRIYKDNKFYESPIKFNKDAVKNFGIATSIKSGFSQIGGNVFKHKETSLEDYYMNRFGKQLYQMFIEEYIEKIWGREASRIHADFGVVSEKSLIAPIISAEKKNEDYEKLPAPYAARYYYPKYGAYQMWETVADRFIEKGGSIHKNCKVTGVTVMNDKIHSVRCSADGDEFVVNCDYLISSMPVRDLILGMDNADPAVILAAENLSYRGMVSVCVELTEIKWKNDTEDYKTVDNAIPDSVIYISNPNVKVSRIQVYNNFSPYMVRNPEHFYLGLNYYCNEGDYYWSMGNRDWKKTVINDLVKLGIIDSEEKVVGYNKTKFSKAFPSYYDGYENFDKIKKYLNKFENLYCVGRNGQHRFSSIDESMKTSFEAVKNILGYVKSKDNIWDVNEKSDGDDGKAYNSALLSGEGEYRGNYVPLQKKIDDNGENKEYVPPRRMRRPMMTPIKKGDPNKLSEPIILNDSVVIAARPEKSIPIASDDEAMDVALTMEELNNIDAQFEKPVEVVPPMPVAVEEVNTYENTQEFEQPVVEETFEKVNDFENESVFENVVAEESSEFIEETPVNAIDEFAAFAEQIDGERLEADPDDEEEEEITDTFETFVEEPVAEFAETVEEPVAEVVETAGETIEEAVVEETVEVVQAEEFVTEAVEEIAATEETVEEISKEAIEEVAEVEETVEEAVEEAVEEVTEAVETVEEVAEAVETEEAVEETATEAEEEVTEEAAAVEEKVAEISEEVESATTETFEEVTETVKSEKKETSGRFVSPIALASDFGNADEKESEESTDSISLPGGGRSVFSRRTRSANNSRNTERWQRNNEKTATKFGKTYNFINDVEETERLVTREQAKAGDFDSAGVAFNKVEKFETDVVDSTNPHERVIMKDTNSDSSDAPRTVLKVTSRFKNDEIPEEIEKERLNCPVIVDKNEDDELSKILSIPIEKKNKKMPDFVPGKGKKGDIEEVILEEKEEAAPEVEETAVEAAEEVAEVVAEPIVEAVEEIADVTEEAAEGATFEEPAVEEVSETFEEVAEETAEEVSEEIAETAEEAVEETVEEAVEEVAFEEPAAEAIEEAFEDTEEVTETVAETVEEITEAEEPAFEEPVVETEVEETVEEAVEEAAFEEPAVEAVEEVAFEEPAVEAVEEIAEESFEEPVSEEAAEVAETFEEPVAETVEEATEEVSFEETVPETIEAEAEETYEEPTYEDPAFAEAAAEEVPAEAETDEDDLLHINEQAASRSIVKSWQNKYNGVGAPASKEDNSNERVVNRGDISSDLYGESFAASLKGKRGVMDYMLDDLDGGKEYVMHSKPESSTPKVEEPVEEKTESAPKDLSSYQIIKESGFRYDSSKSDSAAAQNNDSISPSPVKPLGERKPEYYKKEIDTSIVFKNARVIKSTKITREPEEEVRPVKPERKETVFSDKQKVIAVIRNGEVIPVKDKVEEPAAAEPVKPAKAEAPKTAKKGKKGKKGKGKKEVAESSEEMVQAPISVMLDAKEAAEMTEPLESPIVRNRNVKL